MRDLHYFIKVFVVSVILTIITLTIAKEALSATTQECQKFYDSYIGPVVQARDDGVPPGMMFNQLVMVGIPPELANNLIGMIYVVHKDNDKEFIENDYMNWCAGQSADNA